MTMLIQFSLFAGAVLAIGFVFWATLMPALPRIAALFAGDMKGDQPTGMVLAMAPARRGVATAQPAWRAAA
ncbi:hypothetical protein ACLB0R_13990 [Sphingomonas sp. GlSt437]|uniref:hypothetical protein n=1 Tax=Sphingomonas sp. GlSt437 TaxID=3389970 RepID=UPI003A8C45A6